MDPAVAVFVIFSVPPLQSFVSVPPTVAMGTSAAAMGTPMVAMGTFTVAVGTSRAATWTAIAAWCP